MEKMKEKQDDLGKHQLLSAEEGHLTSVFLSSAIQFNMCFHFQQNSPLTLLIESLTSLFLTSDSMNSMIKFSLATPQKKYYIN